MEQKFFFVALDKNGKKVSGNIMAGSINEGKIKLQKTKLAVVTIEPYDETQSSNSHEEVFQFKGINKHNKVISGTIEAFDYYTAYEKLSLNYVKSLQYLIPKNITEEEKSKLKKDGIPQDIAEKFSKNLQKTIEESKDSVDEIAVTSDLLKEKREFMQSQIDSLVGEAQSMLFENAEYIDSTKKRDIKNRMDYLARLRQSNSIVHLESVVKELLDKLSDDQIFLANCALSEKEKESKMARINSFSTKFTKSLSLGIARFQNLSFDTTDITNTITHLHPIENIIKTCFICMGTLFIGLSLFFLSLYFGIYFDTVQIDFLWQVQLLWYGWIISGMLMITTSGTFFIPPSWIKQTLFYITNIAILIFLVLFFPVIFQWTL